jgi:hygromycin-B 7''-O-kinase
MRLPADITSDHFYQYFRQKPENWLGAALDICLDHGLPVDVIEPVTEGSNLVASVDDRYIVKIFPPFHRHQWESEHRTLQHLAGKTSVPIPDLIAHGERDGWTYVIMSKLSGIMLEKVWEGCTMQEKTDMLHQTGRIMSEIHSLPVGDLTNLEPRWQDFIRRQCDTFPARHRRFGMPEWLLRDLDTYVNGALPALPPDPEKVILTGEYTPFNLLADKTETGSWVISGMIDFGDAMTGFREYDLLGPCAFLCAGNPVLLRALLHGYGYADTQNDPALGRRLMLLLILHRYSNLNMQIRIAGWQEQAASLEELEQLVFPV